MADALRTGVSGGSVAGCPAVGAGSRAGADVTGYERHGDGPVAPRARQVREPGGRSTREPGKTPPTP